MSFGLSFRIVLFEIFSFPNFIVPLPAYRSWGMQEVQPWASGAGVSAPPLNFHTWYRYRGLILLLFIFFSIFRSFFRCPIPSPWKRLNSAIFGLFAIFRSFFRCPSPENIFLIAKICWVKLIRFGQI